MSGRTAAASGRAALVAAVAFLSACAKPAATVAIGLEVPLAGQDGAQGLRAREGAEFALERYNAGHAGPPRVRLIVRDSALHIANPHEDAGQDPVGEPERAAAIVRIFGADPAVVGVVGGLHPGVSRAEESQAALARLAFVTASPETPRCEWFDQRMLERDGALRQAFHRRFAEPLSDEAAAYYLAVNYILRAIDQHGAARESVERAVSGYGCP